MLTVGRSGALLQFICYNSVRHFVPSTGKVTIMKVVIRVMDGTKSDHVVSKSLDLVFEGIREALGQQARESLEHSL